LKEKHNLPIPPASRKRIQAKKPKKKEEREINIKEEETKIKLKEGHNLLILPASRKHD